MPDKYNNDEFIELVVGISFGISAIILLWISFNSGGFSSLLKSSNNGSSRLRGVPYIFMIGLGLAALYYSVKKILQANKKKNDS